jgi:hypothetical protein
VSLCAHQDAVLQDEEMKRQAEAQTKREEQLMKEKVNIKKEMDS